jgi:hypothetical protein
MAKYKTQKNRLSKLGWSGSEIKGMSRKNKQLALKKELSPKGYIGARKEYSLRRKTRSVSPGKEGSSQREYVSKSSQLKRDQRYLLNIQAFDKDREQLSKKDQDRYVSVKQKDADYSTLQQKDAATKAGGANLSKVEKTYLKVLDTWMLKGGRKGQMDYESKFGTVKGKFRAVGEMVKRDLARTKRKQRIEEQKDIDFKRSVRSTVSGAKSEAGSIGSEMADISVGRIRETPGISRVAKPLLKKRYKTLPRGLEKRKDKEEQGELETKGGKDIEKTVDFERAVDKTWIQRNITQRSKKPKKPKKEYVESEHDKHMRANY